MTHASDYESLWKLIKDIRFGMLTHRHGDDKLHSHPLTTQNKSIDDEPVLYFFVPRTGEIATRVQVDPNVNLSYADPGADSYVSLSGTARIVDDITKKQALWSSLNKAWFPDGPGDKNLALLAVRIIAAEYWDVADSKMVQLFKMAKAAMTGDTPPKMGEHKELHIG